MKQSKKQAANLTSLNPCHRPASTQIKQHFIYILPPGGKSTGLQDDEPSADLFLTSCVFSSNNVLTPQLNWKLPFQHEQWVKDTAAAENVRFTYITGVTACEGQTLHKIPTYTHTNICSENPGIQLICVTGKREENLETIPRKYQDYDPWIKTFLFLCVSDCPVHCRGRTINVSFLSHKSWILYFICVCRSGSVWRTPQVNCDSSSVKTKEAGQRTSRGVWPAISVQSASSLSCTTATQTPVTATYVTSDLWTCDPPWWGRSTRSLSSPRRVSVNGCVQQGAVTENVTDIFQNRIKSNQIKFLFSFHIIIRCFSCCDIFLNDCFNQKLFLTC